MDVKDYIVEVLSQLKCEGIATDEKRVYAQCPFHRPRNNYKCFNVSYDLENPKFYCFSCLRGGDLAALVAYASRCSIEDAIEQIEERVALSHIDINKLRDLTVRLSSVETQNTKISYDDLPLRSPNQVPMINYINMRRKKYHKVLRTNYIINNYGLYYCNSGRYSGRIVMPITINGELVGINDRTIIHNAKRKSLHLKGVKYGNMLYGLDQAKGKPHCILVEGAFDLFQMDSFLSRNKKFSDIYGCVCLMGVDFNEIRMKMIIDNFEKAVLLLDGNDAGRNGSNKIEKMLSDYIFVENKTHMMPEDKDIGKSSASFIKDLLLHVQKRKTYFDLFNIRNKLRGYYSNA